MGLLSFGKTTCKKCGERFRKYHNRSGQEVMTCLNRMCPMYMFNIAVPCHVCKENMEYDNEHFTYICANPSCKRYLKDVD